MRLGLQLGYDDPAFWVGLAEEAERCGFDSVWTSEAYGSDAVSPLAWIGGRTESIKLGTAIMQMPARTPATTAATVATLDLLSGNRVLLGLGTTALRSPRGGTASRGASRSRAPARAPRDRADDLAARPAGAPRRALRHPLQRRRRHRPGQAAEAHRPSPARRRPDLPRRDRPEERRARRRDRGRLAADLLLAGTLRRHPSSHARRGVRAPRRQAGGLGPVAAHVPVVVTDDVEAERDFPKPLLALYVGGMGAKGQNFTRASRSATATPRRRRRSRISTSREEERGDRCRPGRPRRRGALVEDRARSRTASLPSASGVTTLVLQARQPEALRLLADVV